MALFERLFRLGLSLEEAVGQWEFGMPTLCSHLSCCMGPSLLLPALSAALGLTPPPLVCEVVGCEARVGRGGLVSPGGAGGQGQVTVLKMKHRS